VIYDIRHVTTYAYESAVSFARCSLRLEPKKRRRATAPFAQRRNQAAAGRAHGTARFLRHAYRERSDRDAHRTLRHRLALAGFCVASRPWPYRTVAGMGERP